MGMIEMIRGREDKRKGEREEGEKKGISQYLIMI